MKYVYEVVIEADTMVHADIVMRERCGYDEQLVDDDGLEFDYEIERVENVDVRENLRVLKEIDGLLKG